MAARPRLLVNTSSDVSSLGNFDRFRLALVTLRAAAWWGGVDLFAVR